MNKIPFNKPTMVGNELIYLQQALEAMQDSNEGIFSKKCCVLLEQLLQVPKILLTTSCTHALELTALTLGIKPGDEVILPSFTFVSTANAFVRQGAIPVFADIRSDTLNMDENLVESLITTKTKALIPVHYAGVGCEMDQITAIAKKNNLSVIEDNAHGLFGEFKQQYLGSYGEMAALSFDEQKNISCVQGGAVIINDPDLFERTEVVYNHGTNKGLFQRGEVKEYTWVDIGSNYRLSDFLAAYLYAQLENHAQIQSRRKFLWSTYHADLEDWATRFDVGQPRIPEYCEQSYHLYYLLLPLKNHRQAFIKHLQSKGIQSAFHFQPLHLSQMSTHSSWNQHDCPVTEDVCERLVRLPMFFSMKDEEIRYITNSIKTFCF